MLSIELIETSAAKESEVDCRKLSQESDTTSVRGVCNGKSRGP
jgi:hypothetical protein